RPIHLSRENEAGSAKAPIRQTSIVALISATYTPEARSGSRLLIFSKLRLSLSLSRSFELFPEVLNLLRLGFHWIRLVGGHERFVGPVHRVYLLVELLFPRRIFQLVSLTGARLCHPVPVANFDFLRRRRRRDCQHRRTGFGIQARQPTGLPETSPRSRHQSWPGEQRVRDQPR